MLFKKKETYIPAARLDSNSYGNEHTVKHKQIVIYTDGAYSWKTDKGGYSAVLLFENEVKEISGGLLNTTSQRMEIMGAVAAFESLTETGYDITLYSDSKYLVNSVDKKWLHKWMGNNFNNGVIKNSWLWKRLARQIEKHTVKFIWVPGHSGVKYNERCDQLATAASNQQYLPYDIHYKKPERELC